MGARLLLAATLLLLWTPGAEALREPVLCFILDAILFLYSLILTILYCRLKFLTHRAAQQKNSKEEQKEEAIYTGLSVKGNELYETLQMKESTTAAPPLYPPDPVPAAEDPSDPPSGTGMKN